MTETLLNHCIDGPTNGPTLLLIHALGADLSFWDDCVPNWLPHLGCLRMDLAPGDIARQVDDLERLRAAHGLSQVVPVGCALGSAVAAAYAARHPSHTAALVMSNPTGRTTPAGRAMRAERAASLARGGMAAILPGAIDRPFHNQPRDTRFEQYCTAFAAQDPHAYRQSVLGYLDVDISADLARITCPALLVPARHDLLFPLAEAEFVHSMMPHAQMELDEDGAHFLPYQRPAAFAARVLGFLVRSGVVPGLGD